VALEDIGRSSLLL